MRALRLLLAGFIATTVLVAGFFAAALIVVTGLAGYLVQLILGRSRWVRSRPAAMPNRHSGMRADEVIDVVATEVPSDSGENKSG